jgi:hypothetical protein
VSELGDDLLCGVSSNTNNKIALGAHRGEGVSDVFPVFQKGAKDITNIRMRVRAMLYAQTPGSGTFQSYTDNAGDSPDADFESGGAQAQGGRALVPVYVTVEQAMHLCDASKLTSEVYLGLVCRDPKMPFVVNH